MKAATVLDKLRKEGWEFSNNDVTVYYVSPRMGFAELLCQSHELSDLDEAYIRKQEADHVKFHSKNVRSITGIL